MKKIEVLKRAKKWAFSKGVSPWILSKNGFFFMAVFHRNYVRNDRLSILRIENKPFSTKKLKFKKGPKKWTFYKGVSPWILSINRTFCYRCLLQKLILKRPFSILWKENNDFKRKIMKF